MIDDIRPQVSQFSNARPVRPAEESRPAADATSPAKTPRTDSVQISPEARAMAAKAEGGTLSPERVAEIRQKILQGAYDSTEVLQTVARRILGSGDLGL